MKSQKPSLAAVIVTVVLTCQAAQAGKQKSAASIASVGLLLAGRYENTAQVAQAAAATTGPKPQHVTITVEATPRPEWQLWHIHMDVDPATAQAAGSDTALDAVWAMNIVRQTKDRALSLVPFTARPSTHAKMLHGSTFDESQWLALEACMLRGKFAVSRIVVQQSVDEMCVAEGMGLGGKRAFLPISIDGDGDRMQVQLIFFGEPWRVDARRVRENGHQ